MLQTSIDIWTPLVRVRAASPLVHNITNYVVMNTTANALLAVGASPAMVHALEEAEQFAALSQALVINIGTLSPAWVEAMRRAALTAKRAAIPWVLDPVGAGATSYRTTTAAALIDLGPTVIRANASEIAALGGDPGGKGVDSTRTSGSALGAAKDLARTTGAIVAMTGAVDYVTDGARTVAIRNGDPLMARVTGLGCTATALVGAFLAGQDPFEATVAAIAVLGVAGEIAAIRSAGPGSLQLELLDALYTLDQATLTGRARVEWMDGAPA